MILACQIDIRASRTRIGLVRGTFLSFCPGEGQTGHFPKEAIELILGPSPAL